MVTYIKKNIPERFLALEDALDPKLYNIGETLDDYRDGKWVPLSEDQATFHRFNPKASVNEVWETKLNEINAQAEEERQLAIAKIEKLREIESYDQSEAVNSFVLNGTSMWLDKATRVGLANSISIEKAAGREVTNLWYGNVHFALPINVAQELLAKVELYALDCYNVTAQHKAYVELMDSVEEVNAFDITEDYPEKLNLNLGE